MPNIPRMHIHFEKCITAQTDCTILSLSWMGKVPDELPEDEGWKLNRNHYYQEGWLATGNVRGIVGVSYTTSHWKRCNAASEVPVRSNYNLRGHRSQVTLVSWNEPYQKLASCDSSGIIFVWIKFEGRWSIELINDRSTPVTHFAWSHDGRMALICYQDGFVLVGSVAGQRYWSTGLNLDGTITCGIWTPDDLQVYFGTSNGQIVVMDVHGTMLSQVQLPADSPIAAMSWSCEKFKMEESEEGEPNHYTANGAKRPFLLAVCFTTGGIYLMSSYDDISPIYISTGMMGCKVEWSNSGDFLAVAGSRPIEVVNEFGIKVKEYANYLHIYSPTGVRVLNLTIPHTKSPVTALTWGHNDKRIFVCTGKVIHVGWVSKRIATLQLLCRLSVYKSLSAETSVAHLPIPMPVRTLISSLHTQTIVSILPNFRELREFVSHPPSGNLRLHCTMIRHEDENNQSPGTVYTLYVEYLGGLVPILKGKRTSKIRPEFVIFDPIYDPHEGTSIGVTPTLNTNTLTNPAVIAGNKQNPNFQDSVSSNVANVYNASTSRGRNPSHVDSGSGSGSTSTSTSTSSGISTARSPGNLLAGVQAGLAGGGAMSNPGYTDSSESDDVELCASPRMQRKRYRNRQRQRERMLMREREREWERTRSSVHLMPEPTTPEQLLYKYNDVLPETVRLVDVTSNIWGTKFKIHGLVPALPENLGLITYKTSLLHLQPRQMTLLITELRDDIFLSPDKAYHYHADEEEGDFSVIVGNDNSIHHHQYSGTGNGGSGEVFHGHHVIYHPQGAGSPVVPPNRCFLQPRTSSSTRSSSSSTSNNNNFQIPSGESSMAHVSTSIAQTTNTVSDAHQDQQSNSTGGLVNNPCELYSDEETEEFHAADVASSNNPDMINLRESLKQTIHYEYGVPTRLATGSCPTTSNSSSTTPVQVAAVWQMCASSSSPEVPRRRSSVEDSSISGGVMVLTDTKHNATPQHQHHHRVKSNLVTRAQIENIIDENSEVSQPPIPQQPHQQSSLHLHRTSSSIRSPTRICWNTVGGESSPSSASPPVIQPISTITTSVPIHVRRSMSASFLDSVDRQGQLSLDIVSNEGLSNSPPKRLILIKKKEGSCDQHGGLSPHTAANTKPSLRDCGKSKSWDSCDVSWWNSRDGTSKNKLQQSPNATNTTNSFTLPKNKVNKTNKVPPATPAKTANKNTITSTTTNNKALCSTSSSCVTNSSNDNSESGGESPIPSRSRGVPQTPARFSVRGRSRSQSQHSAPPEDRIEPVPLPPTACLTPTPTPTTHRRSLSLLTPLLRRRDLNSRLKNQADKGVISTSGGGGNPASSSFIPPASPQHQPRSSAPSTPASQRKTKNKPSYLSSASSPFRQLFANSPLLSKRRNKNKNNQDKGIGGRNIIDSSDEEGGGSSGSLLLDEGTGQHVTRNRTATMTRSSDSPTHTPNSRRASVTSINTPFRDLETFQKQQLRQKLRSKKIHNVENCPFPRRREFVMHNKAPMWNENSQVYQLDFGGRVTQESAKNFQIEFRGKQVMQFGRIDGNAYTLDFQYPFSALQAFAVALANVTQRLK